MKRVNNKQPCADMCTCIMMPYFSGLGEVSGHFYCPNPPACNCFSDGKGFLIWILWNPNLHDFVPSFHMHWGLYLQATYWTEDAHGIGDLYPMLVHREEQSYSILYFMLRGTFTSCIYEECLTGSIVLTTHGLRSGD